MKKPLHEKQKLNVRLTGYAAGAGVILALNPVVKGQVIYSGMQNYQMFMPSDYQEVDMNGDMVFDFAFAIYGTSSTYISGQYHITYGYGWAAIYNPKTDLYNNSWITRLTTVTSYYNYITYTNYYPIVDGLGPGIQIDSYQTMWSNLQYPYYPGALGLGYLYRFTGPYSGTYARGYGDFFGDERYIGVRFYIGTEQHYGWIRASLGEYIDPVTIIDWAYESTPGVGILTGEGDIVGPVATLDMDSYVIEEPANLIDILFNERAFTLGSSDIEVTNGFVDMFEEIVPGLQYAIIVVADGEGEVTVTIPAGRVTDQLGNGNPEASTSFIYNDPSTTSIDNVVENGVNIYPNPVDGNLYIDLENESALRIVTMNGDVVYTQNRVLNEIIDMSGFAPGIYFIQVETDKTVKQHKLIVQ